LAVGDPRYTANHGRARLPLTLAQPDTVVPGRLCR